MSDFFVRATPLKSLAEALEEFLLELSRGGSADVRPGLEAAVFLRKPLSMDKLAACLLELRQRSHPEAWEAVEITFYGPTRNEPTQKPPAENASADTTDALEANVDSSCSEPAAWPQKTWLVWAEETVLWLEDRAPQAVIAAAALLQDGNTAVVRCIILPVRSDGRLGWTRLQWEIHSGADAEYPGYAARAESGRRLQNAYRKRLRQRLGLRRGGPEANRKQRSRDLVEQPSARDMRPNRIDAVEKEEPDSPADEDVPKSTQLLKLRDEKQLLEFALRRCHFMLSDDLALQLDAWAKQHLGLSLRGQRVAYANLFGQAAASGKLELVQALLELGIRVDIVDTDGVTALMRAAAVGNKDIIGALVDAGADVARQDVNGRDCADYARAAGHVDLAEELDRLIQIACEEKDSSEPS